MGPFAAERVPARPQPRSSTTATKAKTLTQFRVEGSGDTFRLHIEDDAGETIEIQATRDQLDVIVEQLDDILDEDDA